MSGRSLFKGLLWIIVAVLLAAHVGGGWYFSNRIIEEEFTPDPAPLVIPDGPYQLTEVAYESPLGQIDAWHLPADGTTWVVHVHDLNATPAQPEVLYQTLQGAGYPQLAIAYRNDDNQPTDPSGYFRYGATEWEDILGAVEFARVNGADEIVFAGYGTGASHVMSFAFRHNFDDLGGIILDSANIDLGDTIDYKLGLEPLPLIPGNLPPTISWFAKFFTSLRIDVNWKSLDYIERAERSLRLPVLAFHGTEDPSIPLEQSIALAETQPDLVQLIQVEGAGHIDSFNTDFDGYVDAVLRFLSDVG